MRRATLIALLFGGLLSGCSQHPTLLDHQEKRFGIKENALGSNHRVFHKVLHYPHGSGLRIPGYIIGIEKANRGAVDGPTKGSPLLNEINSPERKRLVEQSKVHLITHVMSYDPIVGNDAIFAGRLKPCALYSLLDADGGYQQKNEIPSDDRSGRQLFPLCSDVDGRKAVQSKRNAAENTSETRDSRKPEAIETCPEMKSATKLLTAFERSWEGLVAFCNDLTQKITNDGYSHIIVVVMGWNTQQDNAIENYNSILGHLLDEVESHRGMSSTEKRRTTSKEDTSKDSADSFKPLVVGVSWASDWEINEFLLLPAPITRLISFPNKANDAEELGITWLNAVLYQGVLPARAASGKSPAVVIVGHSFGARASLAALTKKSALQVPGPVLAEVKASEPHNKSSDFTKGDLFIALQGAFEINELFGDTDPGRRNSSGVAEEPMLAFMSPDLRTVVTASKFDSANDKAVWSNYAGSLKSYERSCLPHERGGIQCARIPKWSPGSPLKIGFGLCDKQITSESLPNPVRYNGSKGREMEFGTGTIAAWRSSKEAKILYVDATTLMSCRAAFTGGGSHSDIYRRETARFLWELIR